MNYQRLFSRSAGILYLLVLLLWACNKPECKNANPVFDQYLPQSQEYKAELLKQLRLNDQSKLSYWFSSYVESNGQEQLYFNVQGKNLCALIVLDVENWKKLELLREKKGISYQGAAFKNLSYEVKQDSLGIRFIYKDVDRIVD